MLKEKNGFRLADLDTYVFIDVSNIRNACLRSCGIKLDFLKLMRYFVRKYRRLKSVRYFEGLSEGDVAAMRQLGKYEEMGYEICKLSRKGYAVPTAYKEFSCKKCGTLNRLQIRGGKKVYKSNVDVYLASELLEVALIAKRQTHIVLMSCDGDYAEMIRVAVKNKYVRVSVFATPSVKKHNALSIRLKQLTGIISSKQYELVDITSIRKNIS